MAIRGDALALVEQMLGGSRVKRPAVAARGRRPRARTGEKNSLESRYEAQLEADRLAGLVLWYAFEAIEFRLADRTKYRPDFVVMLADLTIEVREVKGHWEDDARVKIKVAAELYPFRFVAVKPVKSGWSVEVIPGVV